MPSPKVGARRGCSSAGTGVESEAQRLKGNKGSQHLVLRRRRCYQRRCNDGGSLKETAVIARRRPGPGPDVVITLYSSCIKPA